MTRTFFFLNLEFYLFVATATLRTSFTSVVWKGVVTNFCTLGGKHPASRQTNSENMKAIEIIKMDIIEWKGVKNPFEITHRKYNSHF